MRHTANNQKLVAIKFPKDQTGLEPYRPGDDKKNQCGQFDNEGFYLPPVLRMSSKLHNFKTSFSFLKLEPAVQTQGIGQALGNSTDGYGMAI